MSQENVEIVRKATEAFRRRDWEALAETIDPHISIRTDVSWRRLWQQLRTPQPRSTS